MIAVSGDAMVEERLVEDLRKRLFSRARAADQIGILENKLRAEIDEALGRQGAADEGLRVRVANRLLNEVVGLTPVTPLFLDPEVEEILIVPPGRVFIYRNGRLMPTEIAFSGNQETFRVAQRLAEINGTELNPKKPWAELIRHDGSRITMAVRPFSPDGPVITIRKAPTLTRRLNSEGLVENGFLSPGTLRFLRYAVQNRLNILVVGEPNTGKTTLVRALAEAIPADERVVTLEDINELQLRHPHRIPLVTGDGPAEMEEGMRRILRMSPSRVILGEVRGAEGAQLVDALASGLRGSMTSLHADSPEDAVDRLLMFAIQGRPNVPADYIRHRIHRIVDLILYCSRFTDGSRRLTQVVEPLPYPLGKEPGFRRLARFQVEGVPDGRVTGHHEELAFLSPERESLLAYRGLIIDPQWRQFGRRSEGGVLA